VHAAIDGNGSAPEAEIVLNMPHFEDLPLRKPGLFGDLRKLFSR
jgi:hypothetical protein